MHSCAGFTNPEPLHRIRVPHVEAYAAWQPKPSPLSIHTLPSISPISPHHSPQLPRYPHHTQPQPQSNSTLSSHIAHHMSPLHHYHHRHVFHCPNRTHEHYHQGRHRHRPVFRRQLHQVRVTLIRNALFQLRLSHHHHPDAPRRSDPGCRSSWSAAAT
jgi:hypothetical protein